MTGIQFLTDEKGRKVAVQIDLRKHRALWEDFYDGIVSERRRKEKGVPFQTVKADLIKRGPSVADYSVEIKPSARRELENLSDALIARLVPKIEGWLPIHDRPAAENCVVKRISGAFASGTTVCVYIIDDDREIASVTRIAHRKDVFDF